MGVWVRIPLVHPEAMDPEVTHPKEVPAQSTEHKEDWAADDSGGGKPGMNGSNPRVGVEDPWETWNTVRMLCEHKTG